MSQEVIVILELVRQGRWHFTNDKSWELLCRWIGIFTFFGKKCCGQVGACLDLFGVQNKRYQQRWRGKKKEDG